MALRIGALFVLVTLFLPKGVTGLFNRKEAGVMNMFAQTKTILTPTHLRERMAPPAPVKLADLRHGADPLSGRCQRQFLTVFKHRITSTSTSTKAELRCIIGPNGAGKKHHDGCYYRQNTPLTPGSAWLGQNIN